MSLDERAEVQDQERSPSENRNLQAQMLRASLSRLHESGETIDRRTLIRLNEYLDAALAWEHA